MKARTLIALALAASLAGASAPLWAKGGGFGGARGGGFSAARSSPARVVVNKTVVNKTIVVNRTTPQVTGSAAPSSSGGFFSSLFGSLFGSTAGTVIGNAISKPDAPAPAASAPIPAQQ